VAYTTGRGRGLALLANAISPFFYGSTAGGGGRQCLPGEGCVIIKCYGQLITMVTPCQMAGRCVIDRTYMDHSGRICLGDYVGIVVADELRGRRVKGEHHCRISLVHSKRDIPANPVRQHAPVPPVGLCVSPQVHRRRFRRSCTAGSRAKFKRATQATRPAKSTVT